jgi:methyl-branched lipid omega-hydroxylase
MVTNWAVSEIDLSDAGFWGRPFGERDAAFGVLRRERPVMFFPEPALPLLPPGPGFWALTRFADVARASREPAIFSSAHGSVLPDLPPGPPFSYLRSMIDMDDPEHARMRRLAAAAFTSRAVRQFSGRVEAACREILDEVIEQGECDFAAEVALPLPSRLICDLLGVPRADQAWVTGQALIAYGRDDPEYVPGVLEDPGHGALAVLEAAHQLAAYAQELSHAKRARPGDDLISRLAVATPTGRPLTGEELAQWFILLVIAGTETTRQAIAHGILMLDRHPGQRAAWHQDFAQLAPTAAEEIVRWSSPVISFRRTLTRDVVLSGQQLAAGDKVMLFYPSANRDERAFTGPYRFDLRRAPNPHLGYGGPGPHHCLGAHLARAEIRAVFQAIFTRMPDLEVTGDPHWLRSSSINGIKHLPVRYTPSRRGG